MSSNGKKSSAEPFIAFIIIIALSALLSAYLTFRVQFERRREPPEPKSREMSFQTMRVKEQEHKQRHEHFHQVTEDINLEAWADKSTCLVCHSAYPHGKNKKAKAIMNLHTEFLTCHACHLKVEHHEKVKFGWVNPTGHTVTGKPYGTEIDVSNGLFADTDDHYSKLAPFIETNGTWKAVTSEEGVAEAKAYMEHEKTYPPDKKEEIKDRLHRGTELKEFIKCSSCHSANGIMNFKELGFSPARINQLVKMEIGGMITNYDVFYFPQIFEEKFK
jgi:hypothetical protein